MTKEQINEFTLRTTQANHTGLVVILFEIEDVYINDALNCYEAADKDGFFTNLEQAKKTHNELMNAMNREDEAGLRMWNLLRYMYKLMIESSVKREVLELCRVREMLSKLSEGFKQVHEKDTDGPVMQNTHQVYAGLTYGKGKLNDSYGIKDYSNRGFKA